MALEIIFRSSLEHFRICTVHALENLKCLTEKKYLSEFYRWRGEEGVLYFLYFSMYLDVSTLIVNLYNEGLFRLDKFLFKNIQSCKFGDIRYHSFGKIFFNIKIDLRLLLRAQVTTGDQLVIQRKFDISLFFYHYYSLKFSASSFQTYSFT